MCLFSTKKSSEVDWLATKDSWVPDPAACHWGGGFWHQSTQSCRASSWIRVERHLWALLSNCTAASCSRSALNCGDFEVYRAFIAVARSQKALWMRSLGVSWAPGRTLFRTGTNFPPAEHILYRSFMPCICVIAVYNSSHWNR